VTALADMAPVLTIPEAAKMLRIGRSAAYDAARRGELPTIKLGRSLRVPTHRLAALLGDPDPTNSNAPAEIQGAAKTSGQADADAPPA
jgi:excisionase family DNA binding protein